ncbi:MAG TPA: hypothetical protein VJP80_08460 [Candidatus Saccharimonadales bacterium]|nr:hypothetical protein [Candidatus Saccharimonadales bacterium]
MTNATPCYHNYLTINHRGKGIPYGGLGEAREDGDANFGFRYAKNNESLLKQIPELQTDVHLYRLAAAINAAETWLFTIGSGSYPIQDEHGHRYSGYMEFAINSKSAIADAQSYFPIFFHFDLFLKEKNFPVSISYCWELQPACFIECDNANGFTCSVFINTDYSDLQQEAHDTWANALSVLGVYLRNVQSQRSDFLYS